MEDEFWNLTSREYNALLQCYREEQERSMQAEKWADMRNALIACLLANPNRDVEAHPDPFEMKDFLIFEHEEIASSESEIAAAIEDEGEGEGEEEDETNEGARVLKAYFTMIAERDKHSKKWQGRKKNG